MQLPIIRFNGCTAWFYHFYMYMFLEIRKMKNFKMAQSSNWLKVKKKLSKVEMHSVFTMLQKDRVDSIIGVTSSWQER